MNPCILVCTIKSNVIYLKQLYKFPLWYGFLVFPMMIKRNANQILQIVQVYLDLSKFGFKNDPTRNYTAYLDLNNIKS